MPGELDFGGVDVRGSLIKDRIRGVRIYGLGDS